MTGDYHTRAGYRPPAEYQHDLESQQSSKFRLTEVGSYIDGWNMLWSVLLMAIGVYILVTGLSLLGLGIVGLFGYIVQERLCKMSSRITCLSCWMRHRRYRVGATPGLWGLFFDFVDAGRLFIVDQRYRSQTAATLWRTTCGIGRYVVTNPVWFLAVTVVGFAAGVFEIVTWNPFMSSALAVGGFAVGIAIGYLYTVALPPDSRPNRIEDIGEVSD